MQTPATLARIAELKAKLAAREGNPIFRQNVVDLKTEIARLEALNDDA